MKILVVCQHYYPEQFRITDICEELVRRGNEVTVITGLPNYPKGKIFKGYRWFRKRNEIINGVNVKRCWLISRGQNKLRLSLNYLSFMVSASFKALFLKKDFDFVMVNQLSPITMAVPALVYKKRTGKKVFLYCMDLWPESIVAVGLPKSGKIYDILYKLSRSIYKKFDVIANTSEKFEDYFKDVLKLEKNYIYLPQYAEEMFSNVKHKPFDPQNIDLVFAGNVGKAQSVETIILAADRIKEHKNIKIHIVGDGSAKEKCEAMKNELALDNVIFHGRRPLSDMNEFYSMADALLLTLNKNEVVSYTLPGKLQSYMLASKPIIASIDGAGADVIEQAECGLCCRSEDYEALAENILKFALDADAVPRYANNSRKYYDEYFAKDKFFSSLDKIMNDNE